MTAFIKQLLLEYLSFLVAHFDEGLIVHDDFLLRSSFDRLLPRQLVFKELVRDIQEAEEIVSPACSSVSDLIRCCEHEIASEILRP